MVLTIAGCINLNNHSQIFSLVSKSHEDCVRPGGRPGPMTEHQSVQYKINDKINYKSRLVGQSAEAG